MAVVNNIGDNRPPPKLTQGWNITTPGIPWYRDIRIIRIIAQIIFAILFIGGIGFIFNNLVTNLNESNLSLNFDIYKGPFSVAISEGPSVTSEWGWLNGANVIDVRLPFIDSPLTVNAEELIWVFLLALMIVPATRLAYKYWFNKLDIRPILIIVGLFIFIRIFHPSMLEPGTIIELRFFRLGTITLPATPVIWILWLLAVAGPLYFIVQQHNEHHLRFTPLIIIAIPIIFLLLFTPSQFLTFLTEYLYPSSMARAFFTGVVNTLRVVFLSLIACTLVGILVGIGLLSSNFLVRNVAKVYVEIFRNTPLLIQLLFIYRSLTLLLPFPVDSLCSTGGCAGENLYAFNARGLYFVTPKLTDTTNYFYFGVLVAFIVAFAIRRIRLQQQELTGEPARVWQLTLSAFLGIIFLSYIIATFMGPVSVLNFPTLQGRNINGGTQFTIGFFSLFLGLTLYTSAFIAEIVRAGIQSVPYGQIEAAHSQGLKGAQVLNLVVLPQALRLIIPPLGNQYVNLGKNSSLGIAVNYAETYRIAQIANNESGQAVPFFIGLMVIYLALSLALSATTNLVNRTTQIRTR